MARDTLTAFDLSANALTGTVMNGNSTTGQVDGHQCLNNGDLFLLVTKSTTSGAITFQSAGTAGPNKDPIAERAYTVETTSAPMIVGPFDPGVFNQQADAGMLYWDYQGTEETEFEVYPVKLIAAR